jgi:hypothetical protein
MTIFETEQDKIREKKAIETFVSIFKGSFKKLDQLDVDFKVFDKENNLIAYAEVKGRNRTMRDAYPLPLSAEKLVKLLAKKMTPVVVWACEDGIIYAKADKLTGTIKPGGRKPREGAFSDREMMVYYEKQKGFKYVRFE